MTSKRVMLTQDGYNKLVEKLEYLKTVRRLEVAERLKAAIALGDLSENSEYDDAKNEQAFIEGEILDLEAKINNSEIIKTEATGDTVGIGSTVSIREIEEVKNKIYAKIKNIYRVVDGKPQELLDEDIDKIYKINENEFVEIDKIEGDMTVEKEKAFKLINISFEEIDAANEKTNNLYRIVDGGFIEIEDSNISGKVYKITDGESNGLYGQLEKIYKVYKVVDEVETYQIVGSTETNPDDAKISNESPVGAALQGKKAGHIAEVHAPVGILFYEIITVK